MPSVPFLILFLSIASSLAAVFAVLWLVFLLSARLSLPVVDFVLFAALPSLPLFASSVVPSARLHHSLLDVVDFLLPVFVVLIAFVLCVFVVALLFFPYIYIVLVVVVVMLVLGHLLVLGWMGVRPLATTSLTRHVVEAVPWLLLSIQGTP